MFFRGEFESDAEEARVYTAALLLVDGLNSLENLVAIWSKPR